MLEQVKVKTVTYIGHSQGTIQMLAALATNLPFFKERINLCVLLAPVARVDRLTSSTLQGLKDTENAVAFVERLGPEILPTPNVDGKISSGFFKVTGASKFGISLFSDENADDISQEGLVTFMGHFP